MICRNRIAPDSSIQVSGRSSGRTSGAAYRGLEKATNLYKKEQSMHRRWINSIVALVFVLAALPAPQRAAAQATSDHYFPETGFTVPARFMEYWQSHGGLAIFGYPITAATYENGYVVQYFERNRFEYHPEFAGSPNEILLGLLGATLTNGRVFEKATPFTSTADRVYFEPTGHSLSGVFLRYWQDRGGLALFGYPISEELNETNPTDGKTYRVQYFERNRFEQHPEFAGSPNEVLLGLLGRDYLELYGPKKLPLTGKPFPTYNPVPPSNLSNAPGGPFLHGPASALGLYVDMYYKDRNKILNAVQDLGATWLKQQVQWKDIEGSPGANAWAELENIVADVTARNLNLVITVVKPPRWANGGGDGFPTDPQYLHNFMKAMAEHYRGKVKGYQIWNEENLYNESGNLDPARYAEILKVGYQGVKEGDPNAVVILGGLTPTGIYDQHVAVEDTWYLDQLYQWHNGEIRNYYDVLGGHPYGYNNPPETMWPDNPSTASGFTNHGQFYFRRVEQQRQIMEKYNDGQKQVWLTEWGWCSDFRPDGYNICAETTLDEQGDYIVRAIQQSKQSYPWMGVMFLWNLNFSTFLEWYTGPAHFSIVDADWTPRPAYNAIKNYLRPGH